MLYLYWLLCSLVNLFILIQIQKGSNDSVNPQDWSGHSWYWLFAISIIFPIGTLIILIVIAFSLIDLFSYLEDWLIKKRTFNSNIISV